MDFPQVKPWLLLHQVLGEEEDCVVKVVRGLYEVICGLFSHVKPPFFIPTNLCVIVSFPV